MCGITLLCLIFFFLNILIIIFHFLNYQLSVLFLIFSHITHLLFFFLFHHALYIILTLATHMSSFSSSFLFLFYLPFLTSWPCFFFILFIYIVTHPFFDSLNPSPSSPNIRSNAFPWYSPSTKLTFHLAQNQYDIFISLLPNTNS